MAKYTGTVDDVVRAQDNSVEFADDTRVVAFYDPKTLGLSAFSIDVGPRGAKNLDKMVEKAQAQIVAAQDELRRLVEQIKANGGGTPMNERALKRHIRSTTAQPDSAEHHQNTAEHSPSDSVNGMSPASS